MSQDFTTDVESNVLVYFTTRWGRLNVGEEGLLYLGSAGQPDSNEWSWDGTPSSRISGTVMWTFDHVPPGDLNAYAWARVDPLPGGPSGNPRPVADVTACALTVFVMPVEEG